MEKVVSFDIETFCPTEELTGEELLYLRGRKDYNSEEGFHRDLATNPYVSILISFSLFFLEENVGYVFYMAEEDKKEKSNITVDSRNIETLYTSISLKDGLLSAEKRLLEFLWEQLKDVDKLISFYGKDFDMEFIKIRTILQGIKPVALYKHLLSKNKNHIDLRELFNVGRNNYSLNFIAKRLNLPIDKGDMDGSKVRDAFLNKEYKKVAEYNLRDAIITGMLYERVKDYIQNKPLVDLLTSAGFSSSNEVVEYALDNGLLTEREVSNLINLYGKGPTDRQVQTLRNLTPNNEPDLGEVCGLLNYETICRIVKSREEEDHEEEIT
ncbi:ribonuclease H-like domain-containing protein [Hydrogenobacter sp. T-2]|uniref:ribonuclease H-like domain-containing protein n=1 Tax=Pampinifervens diazotrophicum TaxID=1632018 RepID=UPI002B2578F0|nr:ribonuclease H-like domain-containing protein [Hydrogenobacter sp. T-2]WPM31424.1 ribonuclease H-like domain-containing protein [Hydrogenobacter sp. T-2]